MLESRESRETTQRIKRGKGGAAGISRDEGREADYELHSTREAEVTSSRQCGEAVRRNYAQSNILRAALALGLQRTRSL